MLQDYDILPYGMRVYLRNYGRHFSKGACDFAISMMKPKIERISKEAADDMVKDFGLKLKGYDHVYLANMCKSDYSKSVPDKEHIALYIKETLNDEDGVEGMVFNRWLADMDTLGVPIDWDELI